MIEKKIEYVVCGDPIKIYETFSDLKKFADLHPLIIDVEELSSNVFLVNEKPYPWLPIKVKYKAKVLATNNEIEYSIFDLPFTTGTIHYKFKNNLPEQCTTISFHLILESKIIGKRILMNKMIKAQNVVMDKLGERLEEKIR